MVADLGKGPVVIFGNMYDEGASPEPLNFYQAATLPWNRDLAGDSRGDGSLEVVYLGANGVRYAIDGGCK